MTVASSRSRTVRSCATPARPAGVAAADELPPARPRPADVESGDVGPTRAASDPDRTRRISDAIVRVYKSHYGKGPRSIRVHVAGDTVTALLRGGFSVVEESLHAAGRAAAVRDLRRAFGDMAAPALGAAVTDVLGRAVLAVLADTCQHPDLTAIVFVLAPGDD